MPRNRALDAFLNKSKEINTELAEDPEARAAAIEIAKGELKEPDSAHADPTDDEPPPPVEETDDETGEEPDAAAAEAEAQAAAAAAAAEGEKPPVAEDDTARELKATRAERDRLRREREESRRQLADARRQLAERQGQPPPQPPIETKAEKVDDPEPNADTHPVEYGEWQIRETRRQLAAERSERIALNERLNRIEQQNTVSEQTRQFDSLMDQERSLYVTDNPDFEAKRSYLRDQIRRELSLLNTQPGVIEMEIANRERQFLAQQAKIAHDLGEAQVGQYALQKMAEMAEIRGYRSEVGANGTQTPTNGTSKAKPAQTPAEKIRDSRERGNAARTASTMSASPAQTRDPGKRMTAEEFLRMNAAQRALYRKQNPSWIEETFSAGESDSNPLLIGR